MALADDAAHDRPVLRSVLASGRALAGQSTPDPVALSLPVAPATGDVLAIAVDVRDKAFVPQRDAAVDVRVTAPDGHVEALKADPIPTQPGRFRASIRASRAGVYRITADAHRNQNTIGGADGAVLVGGVDPEMTESPAQ